MSAAPIDAAAEALARRLLRALPGRQPVARAALDRLPAPVGQVLHARLDARVDREAAPPATPWLDAEHPALRAARSSWREAARSAARVPADAWEDTLAEAARLAVAHLVRPAETLAAYAFAGEPVASPTPDPLPTPLVLERLRAFGPYPYLTEIVERYVDKKGLGHIDRDGLERLLLRIDSRMVTEFSAADWTAHLTPLFELLGGTVPADLLELAFEARDHRQLVGGLEGGALTAEALRDHLATALRGEPSADGTAEVVSEPVPAAPSASAQSGPPVPPAHPEPDDALANGEPATDELATAPVGTQPVPEAPPSEVEPPAPPVIGSKFNAPEAVAPDDSDVIGPARPVEVVAPMQPMATLDTPAGSITDAVVTETLEEASPADAEPLWKRLGGTAEAVPAAASSTEGTPLWARFSEAASSSVADPSVAPPEARALRTDAPLDTLEQAVLGAADADRRAWYTAELFSGDAAAYRAALVHLDAARTWTEATDIIARDVFRAHSVNIWSDPAVTFTDAVEAAMEAR